MKHLVLISSAPHDLWLPSAVQSLDGTIMALTIQQVIDREEIRDLLNRWARGADLPDMDMFESCYTPDVLIEFSEIGYQVSTGHGHREFLEKSLPHFKGMHHILSNT